MKALQVVLHVIVTFYRFAIVLNDTLQKHTIRSPSLCAEDQTYHNTVKREQANNGRHIEKYRIPDGKDAMGWRVPRNMPLVQTEPCADMCHQ
jgi:hypothetical protein